MMETNPPGSNDDDNNDKNHGIKWIRLNLYLSHLLTGGSGVDECGS